VELGVNVRYNMRFMSIEEETEDHAVISFANGEKIKTDLVVGANGIHSSIREYFNPGSQARYLGQSIIFGVAKTKDVKGEDEDKAARIIVDKSGLFGYVPTNAADDMLLFFSTVETPDRPRDEWHALAEDRQVLKDMLQDRFSDRQWPEVVRGLVTETPVENLICWPCDTIPEVKYLSRWGRVIIIGDAAHSIPSTVAQGVAIPIEDGCTLGIAVRHVNMNMITEGGLAAMDLLRRWQKHRKERIAEVVERTKRDGILWQSYGHESALAEKENDQMDLAWLYGYDVEDVDGAFEL